MRELFILYSYVPKPLPPPVDPPLCKQIDKHNCLYKVQHNALMFRVFGGGGHGQHVKVADDNIWDFRRIYIPVSSSASIENHLWHMRTRYVFRELNRTDRLHRTAICCKPNAWLRVDAGGVLLSNKRDEHARDRNQIDYNNVVEPWTCVQEEDLHAEQKDTYFPYTL